MINGRTNGLSVIVCTYNREKYIGECIESILVSLGRCDFLNELIIVNNNSSDNTDILLKQKYSDGSFIYVDELRPGLSHARNAGIASSKYKIVAFVDDDAMVSEDWALKIFDCFSSNSLIGSVGGRIYPRYETPPPEWFNEYFFSLYSILDLGNEDKFFGKGFGPVGANMAVDICKLDSNIFFNTDLGRKGTSLLSGEEVEFLRRYKEKGYLQFYCADATVEHVIPRERLNVEWALKRFYWGGVSDVCSQPNYLRKLIVVLMIILDVFRNMFSGNYFRFKCSANVLKGALDVFFGILKLK